MMGYEWHDLIGNLGVFCILATYLLLQLEKITANSLVYPTLNAIGAAMVVYSLLFDFNLSAMVIEAAWVIISCIGIGRILLRESSLSDKNV